MKENNMPYVRIDDINIYYQVVGDLTNNKPCLIFLHGGAGMADHSIYVSFWSRLSEQVNVIFVDQRGCGRSDRGDPRKWNIEQHGKDVFLLCETLGIEKPIVAGVSWGGYVAISYAIQYPDHPMGLILCNTEAKVSPAARYEAFLRVANAEAANAVAAFDSNWNAETNAEYFRLCLPFYAKRAYTPEELAGCIRNPDLWAKYMLEEHAKFDFIPDLPKIHCPVLHLAGDNDPVHPVASAIETAEHIGQSCELIIIKNTGDPVYRDQPDETFDVMSGFIDKLNIHLNYRCPVC